MRNEITTSDSRARASPHQSTPPGSSSTGGSPLSYLAPRTSLLVPRSSYLARTSTFFVLRFSSPLRTCVYIPLVLVVQKTPDFLVLLCCTDYERYTRYTRYGGKWIKKREDFSSLSYQIVLTLSSIVHSPTSLIFMLPSTAVSNTKLVSVIVLPHTSAPTPPCAPPLIST